MRAKVNEGCIACGFCIDTCPSVFYFGKDGTSEAYGEITSDNEADAKEARDGCPVSVIDIIE